jgi:hypothetical protein
MSNSTEAGRLKSRTLKIGSRFLVQNGEEASKAVRVLRKGEDDAQVPLQGRILLWRGVSEGCVVAAPENMHAFSCQGA